MITIIDYGMGNLRSVEKALKLLGEDCLITSDPELIEKSSGIILPGVGAFKMAMDNLKEKALDIAIVKAANKDIPLLGICLGMQLLFEIGEEVTCCRGLALLKGKVIRLQGDMKIPHMGWNNLKLEKQCALLKEIEEESYVYFVHSYYAEGIQENILAASTLYGVKIPAVVSKDNIFGTQFHPEKSGQVGITMLKNFIDISKA